MCSVPHCALRDGCRWICLCSNPKHWSEWRTEQRIHLACQFAKIDWAIEASFSEEVVALAAL